MEISFYFTAEEVEIGVAKNFPNTYDWDYEGGPFFEEVLKAVRYRRVKAKLQERAPLHQVITATLAHPFPGPDKDLPDMPQLLKAGAEYTF